MICFRRTATVTQARLEALQDLSGKRGEQTVGRRLHGDSALASGGEAAVARE
jgi:hypothetical protein